MIKRHFLKLLQIRWQKNLFVSVGLDADLAKVRPYVDRKYGVTRAIYAFNEAIISATGDLAGAFKPQKSFYDAQGRAGWQALGQTIAKVNEIYPEVPVILDAKVADIGNSNLGYVAMLDRLGADAITVHPYLGHEALKPFLDRADKGVIVLCRTSNPGASEFQDRDIWVTWEELEQLCLESPVRLSEQFGWITRQDSVAIPFYQYVALRVARVWNVNNNCVLVVGATYPEELAKIRRLVGDLPILIPGVGFQQKDVPLETQAAQVVAAGRDSYNQGMIINSSRGIIFAGQPGSDYAAAARAEVVRLNTAINEHRCVAA